MIKIVIIIIIIIIIKIVIIIVILIRIIVNKNINNNIINDIANNINDNNNVVSLLLHSRGPLSHRFMAMASQHPLVTQIFHYESANILYVHQNHFSYMCIACFVQ